MWENQHSHVLLVERDISTPQWREIWQNLLESQEYTSFN